MAINFSNHGHLKGWLKANPIGQRILSEVIAESEWNRRLLAVEHHDRVALYGYGPCYVDTVTQIHATTPRGEILAEQILDESLSLASRRMHYPGRAGGVGPGVPGMIAELRPRKLTIQEYEWWEAYSEEMGFWKNAGVIAAPSRGEK